MEAGLSWADRVRGRRAYEEVGPDSGYRQEEREASGVDMLSEVEEKENKGTASVFGEREKWSTAEALEGGGREREQEDGPEAGEGTDVSGEGLQDSWAQLLEEYNGEPCTGGYAAHSVSLQRVKVAAECPGPSVVSLLP